LNYSLDALQQRYNKAKKDNHKSFRYSLRLRIAVVDGMRNMYYDYAHVVVLAVIELKQVLKIVEDLADYIALGVTGEIEKRQWSGY
jgi:hypothetical protein